MITYKITGKIYLENGTARRIDDRLTVDKPAAETIDLINDYLVRWAMVTGQVVDDWTFEVEQVIYLHDQQGNVTNVIRRK